MPAKEKTKIHPFAGILHPDEEILWMSPPISTRIATKSNPLLMSCFYIAVYGLLIALIVSACVGVLILGNDLLQQSPLRLRP